MLTGLVYPHFGPSPVVVLETDAAGAATDLTVLDVLLRWAAAGIQDYRDRLATMRALDFRSGVYRLAFESVVVFKPLLVGFPG